MKGKPFNVSLWVNFYTFDIMGDLAFGKSFNMLENGVEHQFFTESHKSQGLLGAFRRLIWFFPLVTAIPIINSSYLSFQAFIRNQVETRRKVRMLGVSQAIADRSRIHRRNQMCSPAFWRITMRLRNQQSKITITFAATLILLSSRAGKTRLWR